jgi:glycolate oxidase FAD binding subunit
MTAETRALPDALAEVAGAEAVRAATADDAVAGVAPRWVIAPASGAALAALLPLAGAAGLRLAPRGGGTKGAWGAPPPALDAIVSTARLDSVLEHAWGDMTATAQAGCRIATLQATLAAHGQRLALDPLWPEAATVGGVIATGDSGTLRVRYGGPRDQILGATVALADGTLARSGGKVVKNVAGYDLPKLLTGAYGTLGVITEATLRLYPLPAAERALTARAADVAALQGLLLAVLDSTLGVTGTQLRAAGDAPPALDVRFEGAAPALAAQVDGLRRLAVAAGATLDDAAPDVWTAREALWDGATTVAKISALPDHLGRFCARVAALAAGTGLRWAVVAQAVGLGFVRLDGPDGAALREALLALRADLEGADGSLVVLRPPPGVADLDVWGAVGDALPLMRRLKAEFDPGGLLNAGRFVGGI